MTNLSDREIILPTHVILCICMEGDMIPRTPGYVSLVLRRYQEWKKLANEATDGGSAERTA